MIFASALWLLGLLVLPVFFAVEAGTTGRDRGRLARLVSRPLWGRVVRNSRERWRWLRLGLLAVGAAGILVALARPQWGIVREKVEREGVDVVLALDTSGSMATADVSPSRFFLARAAMLSLVSRLEGDRLGLLAFEGEAYPLAPLTLDADAVGLFLDTVEPGIVPAPGSSLGAGLAKGLDMFVDKERRNKALVLVSDGEDLEGEIEEAVRRAKEAGVVVHTVGVGTERGEPVPHFDREGRPAGFKKDEKGSVVVSRLNSATLEAIARGTGGRFFLLTPADTSLSALAAAIEGMEQKSLAREFSYRHRERFQVPLAIGLAAIALALLLSPPPAKRRAALSVAAGVALVLAGSSARAGTVDEILLKPRRLTEQARKEYERGNHPQAKAALEEAARLRPEDPRARFNVGAGLYKNGKFADAEAVYRALGQDARSPLAGDARFNLGNSLYQKQDYRGAIDAYRDALRLRPDDDARRNIELALRALREQEEQEKKKQQQQQPNPDPDQKQQQKQRQSERPQTKDEKEQERFLKETGMPRERAMALLEALQQGEKNEQKKLLAARRAERRGGKDW